MTTYIPVDSTVDSTIDSPIDSTDGSTENAVPPDPEESTPDDRMFPIASLIAADDSEIPFSNPTSNGRLSFDDPPGQKISNRLIASQEEQIVEIQNNQEIQNDQEIQNNNGKKDVERTLGLEEDTYTLLLVSKSYSSWAFCFSVFILIMQLGFLVGILYQQIGGREEANKAGVFRVPMANTTAVHSGQFIALIFTLILQRDLLVTIPIFLAMFQSRNWEQFNYQKRENKNIVWWEKIFTTYFSRLLVSLLTLFTSFVLIIQSTDLIDLVKDFTALFILSELDDFAYKAIQDGYFGTLFEEELERANDVKVKDNRNLISFCCEKQMPSQSLIIIALYIIMLCNWANVVNKQRNGSYFRIFLPSCDFENLGVKYTYFGDGTCDPKLYSEACHFDGGDCNDLCNSFFQTNVPATYVYWDKNEQGNYEYDPYLLEDLPLNFFEEIGCHAENPVECKDDFGACKIVSDNPWDFEYNYDDMSDCFSDETIYNSDHPYYCWFRGKKPVHTPRNGAKTDG
jgi:hypothetical protein